VNRESRNEKMRERGIAREEPAKPGEEEGSQRVERHDGLAEYQIDILVVWYY